MNIHNNAISVSIVANANTTTCTTIIVLEVLTRIRNGVWQEAVTAVRSATSQDIKDALKRALPGTFWSGLFSSRRKAGLLNHSGLICADFDHVADPAALRDQLGRDPHCVAAWISPSGTGVKALFAVDPTRSHSESWRAVNEHCKAT